jgi:hypothetical protein
MIGSVAACTGVISTNFISLTIERFTAALIASSEKEVDVADEPAELLHAAAELNRAAELLHAAAELNRAADLLHATAELNLAAPKAGADSVPEVNGATSTCDGLNASMPGGRARAALLSTRTTTRCRQPGSRPLANTGSPPDANIRQRLPEKKEARLFPKQHV